MSQSSRFSPQRLALDGILIAVFFALSLFSVEIGGIKLTFDALPVVIGAMLFGPADAFIIGFLGAFLEQLLHYGITATTFLWILPPAIRGLSIGLAVRFFPQQMRLEKILTQRKPYVYGLSCLIAAIITSLLNTLVYYADAKLYGYYSFALIFGVLGMRIVIGLVAATITAAAALPILAALSKQKVGRIL